MATKYGMYSIITENAKVRIIGAVSEKQAAFKYYQHESEKIAHITTHSTCKFCKHCKNGECTLAGYNNGDEIVNQPIGMANPNNQCENLDLRESSAHFYKIVPSKKSGLAQTIIAAKTSKQAWYLFQEKHNNFDNRIKVSEIPHYVGESFELNCIEAEINFYIYSNPDIDFSSEEIYDQRYEDLLGKFDEHVDFGASRDGSFTEF